VIICDVALPDLDGCASLTEFRSPECDRPAMPALALTVLGRRGEQARIAAAGLAADAGQILGSGGLIGSGTRAEDGGYSAAACRSSNSASRTD
jgi:CheY-like chemotaxis protein